MQPECLLMDLDGTIVDSERLYFDALRSIGVDPSGGEYQRARSAVKYRLGQGHVSSHNRALYFKELLEYRGQFSPSSTLALIEKYEGVLASLFELEWKALDRPALFRKLSERFQIALVTNENTRTQLIKLRAIDPNGIFFPVVVCSEDVGMEKSRFSPFRHALTRLGAKPGSCIMVGDHVEEDLLPALELGMRPILTTEFSSSALQLPNSISSISSLEQLLSLEWK